MTVCLRCCAPCGATNIRAGAQHITALLRDKNGPHPEERGAAARLEGWSQARYPRPSFAGAPPSHEIPHTLPSIAHVRREALRQARAVARFERGDHLCMVADRGGPFLRAFVADIMRRKRACTS